MSSLVHYKRRLSRITACGLRSAPGRSASPRKADVTCQECKNAMSPYTGHGSTGRK